MHSSYHALRGVATLLLRVSSFSSGLSAYGGGGHSSGALRSGKSIKNARKCRVTSDVDIE